MRPTLTRRGVCGVCHICFSKWEIFLMSQNIYVSNQSSETIHVLVAPNPDWQFVDVVVDVIVEAVSQALPGLDVIADVFEGLEIVGEVKTIVDFSKLLKNASKVLRTIHEGYERFEQMHGKEFLDEVKEQAEKLLEKFR
jgi:vesicle coat complex subunit